MIAIRGAREAALAAEKKERELNNVRGRERKGGRKGVGEYRGGRPRGIARRCTTDEEKRRIPSAGRKGHSRGRVVFALAIPGRGEAVERRWRSA